MKDDGGPAFPINLPGHGDNGAQGMSLRHWYAGCALQGMLAHSRNDHGYRPRDHVPYDEHWHDAIAEESYEIADAMIRWQRRTRSECRDWRGRIVEVLAKYNVHLKAPPLDALTAAMERFGEPNSNK